MWGDEEVMDGYTDGLISDGTALVVAVFAINAPGCAHGRCVAHEALTRTGWNLHSLTTHRHQNHTRAASGEDRGR